MTPSDRRAFLKQAALLTVATATPGLLGGEVLVGTPVPPPPGWVPTPCRLCGVGCGLLVEVDRGQSVAVRGDPDSPVGGGLACVKGYHSIQLASGRDRITRASLRRGGQLTSVSLREAHDAIASRLRETVREHGKDSVALYGSAQWSITDAYVASSCRLATEPDYFLASLPVYRISTARRGPLRSVG